MCVTCVRLLEDMLAASCLLCDLRACKTSFSMRTQEEAPSFDTNENSCAEITRQGHAGCSDTNSADTICCDVLRVGGILDLALPYVAGNPDDVRYVKPECRRQHCRPKGDKRTFLTPHDAHPPKHDSIT